jgi:prolyl oligopeptidase
MRHIFAAFVLSSLSLSTALAAPTLPAYPDAKRGDVVDTFFGVSIADPYRWLETDVRKSDDVRAWVDAENKVTQAYMAQVPGVATFNKQLTALFNFERFRVPVKAGRVLFYEQNSGLQNQFVLMVRDSADMKPRVLIDPNTWSGDGATALGSYHPSKDGAKLAYQIQDGGTDWRIVKLLDVKTGQGLKDELRWVKFSGIEWAKDGSGFYYARFPEPTAGAEFQSTNLNQAIYFHRLGEEQSQDRLIFSTPDQPKLSHGFELTDDGRTLVIGSRLGTDNRPEIRILDVSVPNAAPQVLIPGHDFAYSLVGTNGDKFLFRTDRDAPHFRIIAIDPAKSDLANWTSVLAETKATLQDAKRIGDKIIADYLDDVKARVELFNVDGKPFSPVKLPGIGTVSGFDGGMDDRETYYSFSSFNTPASIYRLNMVTGASQPFLTPKAPFDPKSILVEQVFYPSKDGTKIPMFLVHKKNVDLNKPHPTLLYGYGGFDISVTPGFDATRIAWINMGGVYAVANLRGGGEYGSAWHDGGRLLNKQNVFDDCIAAGEYLVKRHTTTPANLALYGRSNGGLLVGAVINQRPDLFAAALPAVGVMDMLRYTQFTAGRYWTDDYGDPAEEVHFKNIRTYSPYHNIQAGKDYPAILATTADTDDRVVPGHTFKYSAALQSSAIGPKPHLVRIETRAGHGSGKPTDKIIAEYADMWAFIAYHTGLKVE